MFASVFPTVAALFLPLPCPGITAAGNGTGIVADIPWDADIPAKMQTSLLFLIQVQREKKNVATLVLYLSLKTSH
jgi:hypothetical protein